MTRSFSRRILFILALGAGLSLATSARADIAYDISTDGGGTTGVVNNVGNIFADAFTLDGVDITINGTRTDPDPSTLSTTTISINNNASATRTITLLVSSKDYTTSGPALVLTCNLVGNSSDGLAGQTASGQTWIDNTNTLFGTPALGTSGILTGTLNATGNSIYTFTNGGICPPVSVADLGNFSITQKLVLTLEAGYQGQLSLTSQVTAVPEPSSMAIAGLGALGLIGYGIRRRRAV